MGCGFWIFSYFPLRLLLGREGSFRAGAGLGRMGSDHSAGNADCALIRAVWASQLLVLKALLEPEEMVLGFASAGISKAGPCIVPTAMLGTCSRLSANAAAENLASSSHTVSELPLLHLVLTFHPTCFSRMSLMTVWLSEVSREQN